MLKRLFVVFCLLFFLNGVFANIGILKPVQAVVSNNGSIELGTVAFGETIEIVVQKKPLKGTFWEDVFVDSKFLPDKWIVEKAVGDETIILSITLPSDAVESVQNLKILVSGASTAESFTATVEVKKNLLSAEMQNLQQNSLIGEGISFKAILVNDSIAKQEILLYSNLPDYWFKPVNVALNPKESKEFFVNVFPKTYGEREFVFYAKSLKNGKTFVFPAKVEIYPTLKSKFTEPLYGLPVFSISMLPYYLLNAFVSIFF